MTIFLGCKVIPPERYCTRGWDTSDGARPAGQLVARLSGSL